MLFLVVFQIFTLVYTGYMAFTNYGTGHNGTQEQAISSLMSSALERVPDSATYAVTSSSRSAPSACSSPTPTARSASATTRPRCTRSTTPRWKAGWPSPCPAPTSLDFAEVIARTDEITELAVPFSDDPNDGALRTQDGRSAYLYISTLEYDEAAGTMTDTKTGTVYSDIGTGAFTAEDGTELLPGWQVNVGFDNFVRAFTDAAHPWSAHLRDHLDLRVRDPLGRHDVLPRAVPRDRLQRRDG